MGAGITIVPATVVFSPNSLIKLGLGSPHDYWKQITATVTPANQVSNVTFGASNGEVAVISSSNPATGVVTLTVTAVSETPATTQGASDCNITANFDNPNPLSPTPPTVPVLVLKPTSVDEAPASSDEKSVTNLVFLPNSRLPKGWNVALPTNPNDVFFATQCLAPITITIYDQFGQKLDTMYDGYHIVHETVTGNTTINDQAIDNPDGMFTSGVITDDVIVTREIPDDVTDPQISYLEGHWGAFGALFNAPGGPWDNAIASTTSDITLVDHQAISIFGIQLPGTWDRSKGSCAR